MDKLIWDYLLQRIDNPYGVAGLMGNLYVESKLNPKLLESSFARKIGLTSDEYTQLVDSQKYANFAHDGGGYGLAQWTFWTRKQGLLEAAQKAHKSIGDLDLQLDYLWTELQSYKTVVNTLKTAKSVREASDVVVVRYEKPKNQSEKFLANRANYGQKYFDAYANPKKMVYPTENRVNVRVGNGLNYKRIRQVNKGDSFEYVTTVGEWHAIVIGDQVGWISAEYSKV